MPGFSLPLASGPTGLYSGYQGCSCLFHVSPVTSIAPSPAFVALLFVLFINLAFKVQLRRSLP